MKFTRILLTVFLAAVALVSCKTTEENYRKAYERTVAARAEQDSMYRSVQIQQMEESLKNMKLSSYALPMAEEASPKV